MKSKVISIILLIFIIIEGIILLNDKKDTKSEIVQVENIVEEEASLERIIEELEKNDIVLANIVRDKNNYLIKVSITEEKEEFIEKLNRLNNFVIKDYVIETKNTMINGLITLKYSTKGEI